MNQEINSKHELDTFPLYGHLTNICICSNYSLKVTFEPCWNTSCPYKQNTFSDFKTRPKKYFPIFVFAHIHIFTCTNVYLCVKTTDWLKWLLRAALLSKLLAHPLPHPLPHPLHTPSCHALKRDALEPRTNYSTSCKKIESSLKKDHLYTNNFLFSTVQDRHLNVPIWWQL